jgi:hypothetical protein
VRSAIPHLLTFYPKLLARVIGISDGIGIWCFVSGLVGVFVFLFWRTCMVVFGVVKNPHIEKCLSFFVTALFFGGYLASAALFWNFAILTAWHAWFGCILGGEKVRVPFWDFGYRVL